MKLAIIGGGSTYTPELVDGFARLRDQLPVEQLALVDPDQERLDAVGAISRRMLAKQDHPGKVLTTSDVAEGVEGADAVLFQLRIGGQAARNVDETLPLDFCCLGQETTGAGGLAKAMRTVPVVLELAEQVRKYAPNARIVDFTNPVGIVTRTLLDAGHRAVGLCNVAKGFQHSFGEWLGVDPGTVELDHVGLNHLTWERGVRVGGVDVLPRLLDEHGEGLAARCRLPVEVMRQMGAIPSYYLRYFYGHDAEVAEQRTKPSRAQEVGDLERRLLDLYADPTLDTKPALLEQRGGAFYSEAAISLLGGLLGDSGARHVANVWNAGTLPFLPDDAVIEVPATVGTGGAVPLPVAPLEPRYAGLIAHVAAYEELAAEAAVKGGLQRVEQALLAHPLVGQFDLAQRLAGEIVSINADHLPWSRR